MKIKTLKMRMLLLFIIPLICIFLVSGIYIVTDMSYRNQTETFEFINSVVETKVQEIEKFLDGMIKEQSVFQGSPYVRSLDWDYMEDFLIEQANERKDRYTHFLFALKDGTYWTTTGVVAGNIQDRDYFREVVNNRKPYFISDGIISRALGIPITIIQYPIKNGNEVVGMFGFSVSLENLIPILEELVLSGGYGYINNRDGEFISHVNRDFIMELNLFDQEKIGFKNLDNLGTAIQRSNSGIQNYTHINGNYMYAFFNRINHTPNWYFSIAISENDLMQNIYQNMILLIVTFCVIVGIIILIVLYISNIITNPIKALSEIILKITNKDLQPPNSEQYKNHPQVKQLKRSDELGLIARSLQKMEQVYGETITIFKNSILDVSSSSSSLASVSQESLASSEELTAQSQNIDTNVQNTSASIEEVTSGIEEVQQGSQSISKSSQELQDSSNKTIEQVNRGKELIEKVLLEIKEAEQKTLLSVESSQELVKYTDKVVQITDTITTISDQTNLLALNAAIEQARAGEAGRGFAVVADEIRKLAEESKRSSQDISSILKEIIGGISKTDDITDETLKIVKEVSQGGEIIKKGFDDIIKQTNFVNEKIELLSSTSEEQGAQTQEIQSAMDSSTTAITEIQEQVQQMNIGIDQQSKGQEEVSNQAIKLQEMSQLLEEKINEFKL